MSRSALRLFGHVEFFEQIQQMRGNHFFLYRTVKRAQARADVGIRTKPVLGPARRAFASLGHHIFLDHSKTIFAATSGIQYRSGKKVPHIGNEILAHEFCIAVNLKYGFKRHPRGVS